MTVSDAQAAPQPGDLEFAIAFTMNRLRDEERARAAVLWLAPYSAHARLTGEIQYPDNAQLATQAYGDLAPVFQHGDRSDAVPGTERWAIEAYYRAKIVHDMNESSGSAYYCEWGFDFTDAEGATTTVGSGAIGEQA